MDQLTVNRIKLLHPEVRPEALEAYKYINNGLFGKNVRLRFTHTLRSFDEQNLLFAQGRTLLHDLNGKRLAKITNAKAGQSIHNYGLAFDIAVLVDKDGNGSFEKISWSLTEDNDANRCPEWLQAIEHFKAMGWAWGGDWKSFPDYPHFEKTFGHSWLSLQQKYTSRDTFTEVIDGKLYKWVNL
jgi:peptidoglycan L-alanyl-D-glutamate endopeptidase CwlK